jgi:hypothetical protein
MSLAPEQRDLEDVFVLRCVERGAESAEGRGWRALVADDPRDNEAAKVAMWCPACADRELGLGASAIRAGSW